MKIEKNKIFYILGLFLLLIPFKVNAVTWTNKKPVYTSSTTIEGYQETQVTFQNNFWGDLSGWESPYYYDSGFTKNITWRYDGAPFLGNDWSVRGQIFTTTESGNSFFKNVSYSIYILTDYGTEPCTTEAGGYAGRSGNYTTFTCSGTSTNRMQVVLNTGEYSMNSTYFMLRSDWSELKTDLSNGSLVGSIDNSINESKNDIINNQNQNTNSINNNIDEMKEKQQETNNKLDDMIDSDIPERDKELPDSGSYDDYNSTEQELLDKANEADLSVLDVGLDVKSSSWVWDTLTSLIESHSAIFGMFIAILSIGVIKLVLGR